MLGSAGLSIGALVCTTSSAYGALAAALGGAGFSGSLSSNSTLARQQLICDPDAPDIGSTSVTYNPSVSLFLEIQNGPGYGAPNGGSYPLGGGYVELTKSGTTYLQPIGPYLNLLTEAGRKGGPGFNGTEATYGFETGYLQIFFQKIGTPGSASIAPGYTLEAVNGGSGVQGVDTFSLFFEAANPSLTQMASYNIFAAAANTHSGNVADFMQVTGSSGYTMDNTQIAPASMNGAMVPEPATLGIAAIGVGLLLLRRRRA